MRQYLSSEQLNKWAKPILFGFLLLTAFFVWQMRHLQVDHDFEKFFPMEDKESEFYYSFRERFEPDNDFILIAVENDGSIFEHAFLENLKKLQREIDSIQAVTYSASIVSEKERLILPGGFIAERPYIQLNENQLQRDRRNLLKNKEMRDLFVSQDERAALLFVRHENYLAGAEMENFVDEIHRLLESTDFHGLYAGGKAIGQQFYIRTMTAELKLFLVLSFLLVTFFLLLLFRSGWGLFLPLVVFVGTLGWIGGFIALFGEPVSVVMTTLPTIVFVVGMSDVIHLLSRYLDALRRLGDKHEALRTTVKEVGFTTFLTSLTTAIGFFGLVLVKVQPLQVFGLVTGYGVLIAYVLTIILLPLLIFILPTPTYLQNLSRVSFWRPFLLQSFKWVLKYRVYVGVGTLLVAGWSLFYTLKIEVNTSLMEELDAETPIKKQFQYLDDHFGGVRPFELALQLKDTSDTFFNRENLQEIAKVERYLEEEYGVVIKSSPAVMMRLLNRTFHGGDTNFYAIPESQRTIQKYLRLAKRAQKGELLALVVDSTGTMARLTGSIGDWGSKFVQEKNVEFERFLDKNTRRLDYQITGTAHLLDKNITYLSLSVVQGLSISVAIVAVLMGIIFQSWRMMLISIVPNVLPLLLIAGIMGSLGIALKTTTAIIYTIAFGIAVDDTIHFLGKFKLELKNGRSKMFALRSAYLTTGKAMVLTTFVLCAGFLMLMLSQFQGTFFLGLLICITLFVALIADLTILPLLLLWFYPERKGKIIQTKKE